MTNRVRTGSSVRGWHDVQPVTIEKLRYLLRKATADFGDRRIGDLTKATDVAKLAAAGSPLGARRGRQQPRLTLYAFPSTSTSRTTSRPASATRPRRSTLCIWAKRDLIRAAERYERAQMFRWLCFEQYEVEPNLAVVRFLRHHLSDDEGLSNASPSAPRWATRRSRRWSDTWWNASRGATQRAPAGSTRRGLSLVRRRSPPGCEPPTSRPSTGPASNPSREPITEKTPTGAVGLRGARDRPARGGPR
jgi:hypothetical protein